jgi:hypothetical protein
MAHLLFVLVQNVLTSEEPWAVDLALVRIRPYSNLTASPYCQAVNVRIRQLSQLGFCITFSFQPPSYSRLPRANGLVGFA